MSRRAHSAFGLLAALAVVAMASSALALPRMTLTAGSRCSNCHVNPQGSGLRNELGFYAMAQNGAVTWDKIGWQSFHDAADNQFFGGKVTLGFDQRTQMAKMGAPHWADDGKSVVSPDRIFFPMQLTPAVSVAIQDWLSASGSVNLAAIKFTERQRKPYPGQTLFDAWLHFKPSMTMPTVRVGMLQPTIGIRHDDHTMLLRRNPLAISQPLIPPYWNELGAEVSYEGQHWISVEAGAFTAKNLAASDPAAVKEGDIITSARVTLWPQELDWHLNSWVGASFLKAGGYTLVGSHLGLGMPYIGTLQAEAVMTKTAEKREILSWMVHASHPLKDWCVFEARYEKSSGSQTLNGTLSEATVTSIVAGVQFIPLPNVEIRPEYRVLSTKDWTLGQWAAQLHLWF